MSTTDYSQFARLMFYNLPEFRGEFSDHLNLADRKNLRLTSREFYSLTRLTLFKGNGHGIDSFLSFRNMHRSPEYDQLRDLYTGRNYTLVSQAEALNFTKRQFIDRRIEPIPHVGRMIDQLRMPPDEAEIFLHGHGPATPAAQAYLDRLGAYVFRACAELGQDWSTTAISRQENPISLIRGIQHWVQSQTEFSGENFLPHSVENQNVLQAMLQHPENNLLKPLIYWITTNKKLLNCLSSPLATATNYQENWAKSLGSRWGLLFGASVKSYLQFFGALGFDQNNISEAAHKMNHYLRDLADETPAKTYVQQEFIGDTGLENHYFPVPTNPEIQDIGITKAVIFRTELMRVYTQITLEGDAEIFNSQT